jgi:hypothetical protein
MQRRLQWRISCKQFKEVDVMPGVQEPLKQAGLVMPSPMKQRGNIEIYDPVVYCTAVLVFCTAMQYTNGAYSNSICSCKHILVKVMQCKAMLLVHEQIKSGVRFTAVLLQARGWITCGCQEEQQTSAQTHGYAAAVTAVKLPS